MAKKYTQKELNEMMQAVNSILLGLVGSKLIDTWWSSQNIAFDLKTPMDEWYHGNPEKVFYYVIDAVNYGGH
jgi:hypothetical protein